MLAPGAWRVFTGVLVTGALLYALLVPVLGQTYNLKTLTVIPAFGLATVGLALIFGITHQLQLGHAAFFAGGAYGYAILAGPEPGLPPWLAAVVAVTAVGVVAGLLGRVLLRLAGFFFAVATLGLGLIVENVIFALREITGGDDGLTVTPLSVGGVAADTPETAYALAWVALAVGLALAWNIRGSRTGRAAGSIGLDEKMAAAQAVDVVRVKRQMFVLSAVFAAVGGIIFASTVRFITPELSSLSLTLEFLVAVVLGGMGALVWPVVAVGGFEWLPIAFENVEENVGLVFGGLLIVLMIVQSEEPARPANRLRRALMTRPTNLWSVGRRLIGRRSAR
ncbi:MAG: branched-chain amino acid ABC transporter permease [Actinobacteria bacterium]|nr:branched-chain amino acid ABC transporter permease [Actinomycetota bacterium]